MSSLYMTGNYRSNNDSLERVNTCIHRSNGMEYIEHVFFFSTVHFKQLLFRVAFCLFFLKKWRYNSQWLQKGLCHSIVIEQVNFYPMRSNSTYQLYCTDIWLHQKNSDILFKANIWGYLNSNCKSYTCQTTVTILEIIHYN